MSCYVTLACEILHTRRIRALVRYALYIWQDPTLLRKLSAELCISVITVYLKCNYADAENFILWLVHGTSVPDGTYHTAT